MSKAIDLVQKFYPNVVKVKDATKPLEVTVAKTDVDNSKVRNHKDCVFAHACKRMEDIDGAIIAIKSAYIIKGDTAIRYSIPDSLAREIVAFDRDGKFETGDYYVREPSPTLKLGQHKLYKPKKRTGYKSGPHTNSGTGQKTKWHATKSIRSLRNPEIAEDPK